MRLDTELCHIEANKALIKATGWIDEKCLGSAHGEAKSVEEAEDRAINRLMNRIKLSDRKNTISEEKDKRNTDKRIQIHKKEAKPENNQKEGILNIDNPKVDQNSMSKQNPPLDWSNELAAIDHSLKKLGWDKEDETNLLINIYSVKDRNRITDYNILVKYKLDLESLNIGITSNQAINKIKNKLLIYESDKLITSLNWSEEESRQFLKKNHQVQSRQELSNSELQNFNKLLKNHLTNKI